jgi:chromosomal replication initiation ATPase DnaA|tara:strand:+ start:326 stop:847 length:522 start_codon:yes stop_codon:yes gene_type:complete
MTINISQHYNTHIKNLNQNHFVYKVKKAFYLLTNQEERLYEVGFSEGFLYAAELLQQKPIIDSNNKNKVGIKYKNANIEVVSKLVDKVCQKYTVSKHDVFSKGRTTDVVRARSIVYNLLHEEYNVSVSSMSRVFNQDHTTVLHSLKNKIEKKRYWNPGNTIWEEFEDLRRITF